MATPQCFTHHRPGTAFALKINGTRERATTKCDDVAGAKRARMNIVVNTMGTWFEYMQPGNSKKMRLSNRSSGQFDTSAYVSITDLVLKKSKTSPRNRCGPTIMVARNASKRFQSSAVSGRCFINFLPLRSVKICGQLKIHTKL